eukprot:CAMPEP_0167769804 /NCGR_PEP_ID=MMETSP0110_2-20121227/17539_1 /TAXON_ID=629695 /ORGANISM="Gymnochlora sp., Strain CCMP2014" /LENGTH=158 /DNA_ID=CAMNT_0007658855 /DNA_START=671 /DNA_END=1144 /DNA_ORIENTATION=-
MVAFEKKIDKKTIEAAYKEVDVKEKNGQKSTRRNSNRRVSPAVTEWFCDKCAFSNSVEVEVCEICEMGKRPKMPGVDEASHDEGIDVVLLDIGEGDVNEANGGVMDGNHVYGKRSGEALRNEEKHELKKPARKKFKISFTKGTRGAKNILKEQFLKMG